MNLFYEEYPVSIEVDGEEIPIVTDFRDYVRLADMLKDSDISYIEKFQLMSLYFKKEPDDFKQAIDELMRFVTMESLEDSEGTENIEEPRIQKELYSFSIDYPFIFSAFLHEYGINIRTIKYMHWWEFQLLFKGLPEDTEIKQRIMYRSIDLSEIKDQEERKRIEKIKRMVKLPTDIPNDYEIGDAFGW